MGKFNENLKKILTEGISRGLPIGKLEEEINMSPGVIVRHIEKIYIDQEDIVSKYRQEYEIFRKERRKATRAKTYGGYKHFS